MLHVTERQCLMLCLLVAAYLGSSVWSVIWGPRCVPETNYFLFVYKFQQRISPV